MIAQYTLYKKINLQNFEMNYKHLNWTNLPVADRGFASEGLPDVEGRPMEDLGPREVFFSRTTCLPWLPMFKVPRVVLLIAAKKYTTMKPENWRSTNYNKKNGSLWKPRSHTRFQFTVVLAGSKRLMYASRIIPWIIFGGNFSEYGFNDFYSRSISASLP